jgi:hypothetical protein
MGTPAQKYFPQIDKTVAPQVTVHLQRLYTATNDHDQAIVTLKSQLDTVSTGGGTKTINTVTTITSSVTTFPGLGAVNNQEGATTYTTQSSDNGILLLLSDASPIAVALNSVVTTPYFLFVTNLGAGTATLTPSSGTIDGGATFTLLQNYTSIVSFDGTNWWATALPVVPVNTPAVTHEWINAYNATTGVFTQTQPAYSDISGTPNFADDETVSGSGTSWTLAHTPAAGSVPILVVQLPSFGGVTLINGQTPGFTISGASITTTNSYLAGALFAWYRY